MAELDGTVALVTGASAAIDRAVALELARQGSDIVLIAKKREGLEEVAGSVRNLGRKAHVISVDVTSADAVKDAVKEVLEDLGRIDILVNNTVITASEDWDRAVDAGLKGAFLFSRAVARVFLKQKSGRIVNIASVVGNGGNPGQTNESALKGGLMALTYTLAKELSSRGILVNAVAPGLIETSITEQLPSDVKSKAMGNIPVGRFGKPEEVASVVAFLAGPGSTYINGVVLRVDGGLGI